MMPATELAAGFTEPVHGAQKTFRAILDALARPGKWMPVAGIDHAPEPLTGTLAATALTLLDQETAAHLVSPLNGERVSDYLAFHTGAHMLEESEQANFILCIAGENLPDFDRLATGTADYPDRSATLLIAVEGFDDGLEVTLSGPGIETAMTFAASGLGPEFWSAAKRNSNRYPLGIDFLFCSPAAVAGLPRSTRIGV